MAASPRLLLVLASCLLLCLSCLPASVQGGPVPPASSPIVNLNDGSFSESLAGREAVVVFVAPWCGACTAFAPTYAIWAEQMALDVRTQHVLVGRVDCTLNPQTEKTQKITSFPSIRFYRDGRLISDFTSDRTASELTRWIAKLITAKVVGQHPQPTHVAQQPQQATAQQQPAASQQKAPTQTPVPPQAKSPVPTAAAPKAAAAVPRSTLPDPLDLTDPQHLKRVLVLLLELPLALFATHPYMVMSICWAVGLFQGLFVGLLILVREKR